jgi:hypothetical protein
VNHVSIPRLMARRSLKQNLNLAADMGIFRNPYRTCGALEVFAGPKTLPGGRNSAVSKQPLMSRGRTLRHMKMMQFIES